MYELRPRVTSDSKNASTSPPSSSAANRPTTLCDNPPAISSNDRRSRPGQITRQDRSQVEEQPPPAEPAALDCPIAEVDGDELEWCIAPLIALAQSIGSTVRFEAMHDDIGGYYDPTTKAIAINDARTVNAKVKTLAHELAHALLRAEPGDEDPDLSYAEEELIVESIAYTVCGSVGLDVSGFAIPYLASWAEDAPLETLQACAGMIDRYASRLESVLEPAAELEAVA